MIGKVRIRKVRLSKKITQTQLANLAEMSQSYLSELESNKKSPTLRELCKVAEALNVHPSKLVYYLKSSSLFRTLNK